MGLKILLLLCATMATAVADEEYFEKSGSMYGYGNDLYDNVDGLADDYGEDDEDDYDPEPKYVGGGGRGQGAGPARGLGHGHGPPNLHPGVSNPGYGGNRHFLGPGPYHRPRRVLQRCRTSITPYGSTCSGGFLFSSSKKCSTQKCYHQTSVGYTLCDHHPVYLYKPYGKKTIQCKNDYQQCKGGLLHKCYCRTVWCKRKVKKIVKVLNKYRAMYVYVTYPCKCQCRRKD